MQTQKILSILIALVVVGGGFFLFLNDQNNSSHEVTQDTDTAAMVTDDAAVETTMENALSATLEDVSGGNATGTAYISRDERGLSHTVTATLPDPAGNNVYEGWLVKKLPVLSFFSTGVMQKDADGMYTLSYSQDAPSEGYDFVVITEETIVDATPEGHILEGTVR